MEKTTKAQRKSSREYEKRNREKTRVDNYKRSARLFVRSYANDEDMEELNRLYKEKKREN